MIPDTPPLNDSRDADIAIVGLACRFPGADDSHQFWRNLCAGVESLTRFEDAELRAAGVPSALLADPRYVKAGAVLSDITGFDAGFFDYSAAEAELLDPQQRLFLECAWEALEQAACVPDTFPGAIGCFAGAGLNGYLLNNLYPLLEQADPATAYQILLANDKDFLATRTAYKLNLKGPCVTVQTACSTSLVAVHLACQALLNGECDLALAGGVTVRVPQRVGYLYQEGLIFSPDGHCRAFDADAQGMIGGSGAGVVVLQRCREAQAAGARIHALIKGSAINNDGSRKAGFTAPGVDGQAAVIAEALAVAGVDPDTIGYIEAHGTGTGLGDPIEVAALTQAFRAKTRRTGFCALGSVKTNFGHLDAAAGVAGLIKAVLAVEHGLIPPSLHFRRPNPKIDFAATPFYVNTGLRPWEAAPRRAGVSSFGIGGGNAHVVLEQAPPPLPVQPSGPWQLLTLSAKTATALEAATARLVEHLERHPPGELADLAYTLNQGRKAFRHRWMLVCRSTAGALAGLREPAGLPGEARAPGERPVAFLFPGQGAQAVGMGADLYRDEPVFRDCLDECAERLRPSLGLDLRRVLYPGPAETAAAAQRLQQTALAQPALFAVEYALARLWLEWGVRPQALLGHSLGEYVAACLAGVFSLDDALVLVAERGRLMQALPGGAMLAVPLAEQELAPLLDRELDLAACNGPAQWVVSGPTAAVESLERRLQGWGVESRRLATSHAFHSALLEPVVAAFRERVARVALRPPRIPYLSNVSGDWIRPEEATDPAYWAGQLRRTVRFADGLDRLFREPERILLEVGPGRTLSALARQHPACGPGHRVLSALGSAQSYGDESAALLDTLGRLWLAGAPLDWRSFYRRERRRCLALPGYPFERQRCWIEARTQPPKTPAPAGRNPETEWFYLPSWQRSLPPPVPAEAPGPWLVFADSLGIGQGLARRVSNAVLVYPGVCFARRDDGAYTLNPHRREDYAALVGELRAAQRYPHTVLHAWSVTGAPVGLEEAQYLGFYSLLFLVQALGQVSAPLRLLVIADGLQDVTGSETLYPEKATLSGILKAIPQEYPLIRCRSLDIVAPIEAEAAGLLEQLWTECRGEGGARAVAYRGPYRWEQRFEPVRLPEGPPAARLRPGGVYLIIGGFGGIGYTLAEHLARTVQARLILVGRSALPPQETWADRLAGPGEADPVGRRIRRVQALQSLGAQVLAITADVTERVQLEKALAQAGACFGALPLDGVIYAAGGKAVRSLQEIDEKDCAWQFRPKLQGLTVLEEVLGERPLDFCVIISSLAAVLGALGLGAYAAAHAFTDAFVQRHNRRSPVPWLGIDWDNWLFEESSPDPAFLTPAEGVRALSRILGTPGLRQVLVSTWDLQERLERWVELNFLPNAETPPAAVARHPRPALAGPYVPPATDLEKRLAALWQALFGFDRIGSQDNFFELGGDSMLGIQLTAKASQAGLPLTLKDIFEQQTVAALATALASRRGIEAEQGPVTGSLPLTPIQEWFFAWPWAEPRRFNQTLLLEVAPGLSAAVVEEALHGLALHHDALRLRFTRRGTGWEQRYADPADRAVAFAVVDLSGCPAEARQSVQKREAARLQAGLSLSEGPLFGALWLHCGTAEPARLLLVCHHLAVDIPSWQILYEDLETACRQLSRGEPVQLPAKTSSYKAWAEGLRAYAVSQAARSTLESWLEAGRGDSAPLPRDFPEGTNTFGSEQALAVSLSAAETQALVQRIPRVQEALLGAVAYALGRWSGQGTVRLDLEGHGREPPFAGVDLARTVGWFTSLYPLALPIADDPETLLGTVQARLQKLPDAGISYGALRYSGEGESAVRLGALPRAEAVFLYLGQVAGQRLPEDALLRPLPEGSGLDASPDNGRPFLLEINAALHEGGLEMLWKYSTACHRRSTIEGLAGDCLELLRTLGGSAPRYRAEDFPEAGLSQEELDALVAGLDKQA